MAVGVVRVDDVLLHDDHRQILEAPLVHLDGLRGVPRRATSAPVAIEDGDVDEVLADMVEQDAEVIGSRQPGGLARLCGHVADVHLEPGGRGERVADVADEQVRKHAAEQASRADDDQVRLEDALQRLGRGAHVGRLDRQLLDRLVRLRDADLALEVAS